MKKLYVKTYGCQMNMYDSSRMIDTLTPLGYGIVDTPEDADIAMINTCHIREKAEQKLYSDLGRLKPFKDKKQAKGTPMIVIVAGCVAQAVGETIIKQAPYVDIVVGPQSYHQLPEMIAKAERAAAISNDHLASGPGRGIVNVDFPVESKFDFLPIPKVHTPGSAFVSVQEGCDKFCTFCVVPYTRGAEFSRPVHDIIKDVKHLIHHGVKEIYLLGQNVNAYHGIAPDGKEWSLGRLLFALADLEGIARLRYTTSHPRDMHEDLYRAHGEIPQLMPFLHLPVQSGSDNILRTMNRKHTIEDYIKIIDRLRHHAPHIALSSDFIVGFPGETDEDFKGTLDIVDRIGYAQAYSFKYSIRPGTPGALMDPQVPEDIKEDRLQRLQEKIIHHQVNFNKQCIGLRMSVLFDRPGKHPGQLIGKSPYLQSVVVSSEAISMGTIHDVMITEGHQNSLRGVLMDEQSHQIQQILA